MSAPKIQYDTIAERRGEHGDNVKAMALCSSERKKEKAPLGWNRNAAKALREPESGEDLSNRENKRLAAGELLRRKMTKTLKHRGPATALKNRVEDN